MDKMILTGMTNKLFKKPYERGLLGNIAKKKKFKLNKNKL